MRNEAEAGRQIRPASAKKPVALRAADKTKRLAGKNF